MIKPVVLTIIDGLGFDENRDNNAWKLANTPMLDELIEDYPFSRLAASGKKVGLPEGQIGNSEVGHLNIGAGQVVFTGLALIKNALKDGSFFKNEAFLKSVAHAKKHKSTIQVMGLLSEGGVHSLEGHLWSILEFLNKEKIKNVVVHAFTDGRDVAPRSVKASLIKLNKLLDKYGYKLGSIQGRLYAMDRDSMFEKTEKAFEAIKGNTENTFDNVIEYIDSQYNTKELNDEFIEPAVNSDPKVKFLSENDSVIFFNFRPDRARQLSHLMVGSSLYDAKPAKAVKNLQLTIMMKYEGIKADVAFESMDVETPIGKVISEAGLKQLRIAETQKYAHVTFFMDGGVDIELKGADRILVPSLKIDNFATNPEMSAEKITKKLVDNLDKYDFVIVNYANPDMVGHTGDLEAAKLAVEITDKQIATLKYAVDELGGTMFVTADHGNAEIMADVTGVVTKHTTSDVPFICTDKDVKLENGALGNIAPTILDYLEIEKPKSMDHKSLLK